MLQLGTRTWQHAVYLVSGRSCQHLHSHLGRFRTSGGASEAPGDRNVHWCHEARMLATEVGTNPSTQGVSTPIVGINLLSRIRIF